MGGCKINRRWEGERGKWGEKSKGKGGIYYVKYYGGEGLLGKK